jgi:hypothetical protein
MGYAIPLFRCVGLGVVVQHLFMVLGGRTQHDVARLWYEVLHLALLLDVVGAAIAWFVLPKGVWTLSTLTSALLESL